MEDSSLRAAANVPDICCVCLASMSDCTLGQSVAQQLDCVGSVSDCTHCGCASNAGFA